MRLRAQTAEGRPCLACGVWCGCDAVTPREHGWLAGDWQAESGATPAGHECDGRFSPDLLTHRCGATKRNHRGRMARCTKQHKLAVQSLPGACMRLPTISRTEPQSVLLMLLGHPDTIDRPQLWMSECACNVARANRGQPSLRQPCPSPAVEKLPVE